MKSVSGRLEALEADTTPKQAVMALLDRLAQGPDMEALIRWSFSDSAVREIETRRQNLYESARRHAKKGDADRACFRANQAFDFLLHMAFAFCDRIERDRYRYLFGQQVLITSLDAEFRALQEPSFPLRKGGFRNAAGKLAVALMAEKRAAELVSQKYFSGKPLLASKDHGFLEHCLAWTNDQIALYNEGASEEQRLDEDELAQAAEANAQALVEAIEQEARILICEAAGWRHKAMTLYRETFQDKLDTRRPETP